MEVAVLKEKMPGESRVAATPETVKKMVQQGFVVSIQEGAGAASGFLDQDYLSAGARIAGNISEADVILKVRKPLPAEAAGFKEGAVLITLIRPMNPASDELMKILLSRKISCLAMELVPRIARAQKLDALSSQAGIAGYKAVLLAANASRKFFPMAMTAAGTIPPARVLVVGAGVAGLQAVATAKRLGAVVEAFDTRPAVKEQVESLGGKFIELTAEEKAEDSRGYATELSQKTHELEMQLIAERAAMADAVITTAIIPGKKAPVLISEETMRKMKPGSVIVDLAAERGGNCALTVPGQETFQHGVRIIGYTNLPGLMAHEASQLYARNILNMILEIWKEGRMNFNLQDEIIKSVLLTHQGEIVSPLARDAASQAAEV